MTTVADVTVVYATLPFVTAAVAWTWTRERSERRLLAASLVALCGVAAMVADGFGNGTRLAGMALALAINVGMAVILLKARRNARTSNAVYTLGTALSAGIGFALARNLAVTAGQLTLLVPFGLLTMGLAMALYMAGARRIPLAEVGLISMSTSSPARPWCGSP